MNSIVLRLHGAHPELNPERLLVAGELAVLEPGAGAEPQDGVPLPLHPQLVVRRGAGAHGALEQDVVAVGQRDGDQRGLLGREGQQPGVEEVAELPRVLDGEGLKEERVAVGLYGVRLCQVFKLAIRVLKARLCI